MKPSSIAWTIVTVILSLCICSSDSHAKSNEEKDLNALRTQAEAGDVSAMNNLASLLLGAKKNSLRDYKTALVWAQRAVQATDGKCDECFDTLAAAEFENGNYEEALLAERKALALKPDDASYLSAVKDYERIVPMDAVKPANALEQTGRAGVTSPREISAPAPENPSRKFHGKVMLYAVVGEDGRVRDVRVARSFNIYLDRKAVIAVKSWTFEPAKKDGHPAAVPINVEVNFNVH